MEPDLDLNKVVRTEAGKRSGERLLLGKFYAPSRPPTAGGAAGGLSNGSRAGSARGGGLMNVGAVGDAPLMLPVTFGARHAAAETVCKEPAAAAPVLGASSKMNANVKLKTLPAEHAVSEGASPPTVGDTEAFSSRPKLPRTPHAGIASSSRSGCGRTTPRTHGCSNSPPNSPAKPTYSETLPNSRPSTASGPTSATAANGVNGATKPK